MPLRKSPQRTRALLAANRRNSRRSTGPRTAAGKRHSRWNAVRHGRRARTSCRCTPLAGRDLKTFMDFYFELYDAIIPAESLAGHHAVLAKALEAWKVKCVLDRWIETRTEEDWLTLAAGAAPPPNFWRLKLRRPGVSVPDWTVTISVWLRWGRGRGRSWGQSGKRSRPSGSSGRDNDKAPPWRPRMHTMVSVHRTGPSGPDVGPGLAPAMADPRVGPTRAQRTKPECYSSQISSENMWPPADWDPAYAEAYALAERIVGWLMRWGKRTKPEYNRKQAACKNMSPAGERGGRNPGGSGAATSLGRIVRAVKTALTSRKERPQLPPLQTKPESLRKDAAYKNMSKALGWLGAPASFLLKCGRMRGADPTKVPRSPASGCFP